MSVSKHIKNIRKLVASVFVCSEISLFLEGNISLHIRQGIFSALPSKLMSRINYHNKKLVGAAGGPVAAPLAVEAAAVAAVVVALLTLHAARRI